MKVYCKFFIDFGEPDPSKLITSAYVKDRKLYDQILDIAHDKLNAGSPRRNDVIIKALEGSDELIEVCRLLKLAGYTPHYGENYPENPLTHYMVRRFREYDKKDFQKVEYFKIGLWGNGDALFHFAGIKDGLVIGNVKKAVWKKRCGISGYTDISGRRYTIISVLRALNDELKRDWEALGMKGVGFKPVLMDEPKKAKGAFWELTSNVVMPKCQLPLIKRLGFDPPQEYYTYDDGGHLPQELVFKRAEVEAIGPFDMARTAVEEDVLSENHRWPREFIVTAAARLAMIKQLKLSSVQFVPVRLI